MLNIGACFVRSTDKFGFTPSELRTLRALKTPVGVQKFVDELPYNLNYTARSPKKVIDDRIASCLEGGIFAAAALRVLGFPPLIFDLEAEQDTDHVVAIFKMRGHWGAVAKSNFTGCRYREPVYRSLRELAMSYFNIYFNLRGERTLRRYSRPVNLARFDHLQLDDHRETNLVHRGIPLRNPAYLIADAGNGEKSDPPRSPHDSRRNGRPQKEIISALFTLDGKQLNDTNALMKRTTTVAVVVLLLAAAATLTSSGTLLAFSAPTDGGVQRSLTLQERVSYQRAIEEVYWRHRIWPKENANPKPSLDAVISHAQLEKKVEGYLRNSQALDEQRSITARQLQAEMDRMAQNTKQPEVLQELFAALGNDPFVIAECLARPMLAERLLGHPELQRVKQQSRTFDQTVAGGANYTLPTISDPSGGCIEDAWTPTKFTGSPEGRVSHTAVWTGSEMIVWGGSSEVSGELNTGGRYNPSTDSWTATSTTNAPEGRVYHTAVWTGSEMIVWGGEHILSFYNTGGRYNPVTDNWTATSTTNAPQGRAFHTAVWTGTQMIVWGGFDGANGLNTGGRYNPANNSWTATSTTNAPSARSAHTAVWTDSQMIIWGGGGSLNTGGRYNPNTNSWTTTSTANAPEGRHFHTAVWTGRNMIVWGGSGQNLVELNTGGRYNPSTNSWTATSTANAPEARSNHPAVWTGSNMIVWGGFGNNSPHHLNTGGRYYPDVDSWASTSITNAPSIRSNHSAVWTGSEMVVWGGNGGNGDLNTGGKYCVPSGPPPTPTPTPPPPTPTPIPTPCPGGCVVTNTNDNGPGSLRRALAVAQDGDRITFTVSGIIRLTSGGLGVTKNVTISGPGANQLAVDGNQALFVFGIFPQRTVSISGLSIRNAQIGVYNNHGALSASNCVLSANSSAALYNDASQGSIGASMTVANSIISNNSGTGAYNNEGTLAISSCVFSGNSTGVDNYAGGSGGASMTVTNSIISNNSGIGAFNFLPLPDGSGCACMTITNSTVSNNARGGISNAGNNFGNGTASLMVVNSNVTDNDGIGITNNGCQGSASATILSTAVTGNSAGGVESQGLCALFGSANVTITDCTISGNSANGGIRSATSALAVANSTVSGNSSGETGGGIFASSVIIGGPHVSIVNSTVSGNSAGTSGGGISNVGSSFHVESSTITGNSAGSGGGIYNDGGQGEISNTILNAGALGANIFNSGGSITTLGYNLSSDDGAGYLTGPGDQINIDPLLGPLQDNGGPTLTHLPLPGSPAINTGDPNFTPPPFRDQRGRCYHRIFGRRIDIGSVETQPRPRCVSPAPRPTPQPRP